MAFLGLMTVREHERVLPQRVALAVKFLAERDQHIRGLQIQNQTHVELGRAREKQFQRAIVDRDALAAELATLKAERDSLLEDKMAMAHDINDLRKALAHWKKHGQLRDPATGRLIPKAQAARGGELREGV